MAVKKESLELALDLEREGYEYYTEHANKTANKFTQRVLESLASREEDHIRRVKEIAEGHTVADMSVETVDVENTIRDIFEDFSGNEKEGWKDEEEEVYEHGLELEQKLYDLYKNLSSQADDPEETDFFEALMVEENQHYQSLQNVVYYLTDHDRWMAEKEGEIWGWMNI